MGQYWIPVNLDKREYVHPHKLGSGLKLWEQLANSPGVGAALIVLTAAMPEQRGGGDLSLGDGQTSYGAVQVIGRWAGDRIAIVGDYAQVTDLAKEHNADLIYSLCQDPDEVLENIKYKRENGYPKDAIRLSRAMKTKGVFTDITGMVAEVIERELNGKYTGDGWRTWKETPNA